MLTQVGRRYHHYFRNGHLKLREMKELVQNHTASKGWSWVQMQTSVGRWHSFGCGCMSPICLLSLCFLFWVISPSDSLLQGHFVTAHRAHLDNFLTTRSLTSSRLQRPFFSIEVPGMTDLILLIQPPAQEVLPRICAAVRGVPVLSPLQIHCLLFNHLSPGGCVDWALVSGCILLVRVTVGHCFPGFLCCLGAVNLHRPQLLSGDPPHTPPPPGSGNCSLPVPCSLGVAVYPALHCPWLVAHLCIVLLLDVP